MMKTPTFRKGRKRRSLTGALALIIIAAIGGAVIWGFLESREEMDRETEREKPVKTAVRMGGGSGVIHIERTAQARSGIETARLPAAPYINQIRAYGMVLDVARLTDLSNNYVNAEAQLRVAQAKVTFSRAAFE